MIEILPAPAHVAAFRLSGQLTAGDYSQITSAVEEKLKTHQQVGVYTEAQELSGVTPGALAKDVGYALGKLGEFDRFGRGAVVTDKPWLRAVTTLSNSIVRSTELRTFGTDQRAAAMSWVAELHTDRRKPALRLIPTTRLDTVAFAWNGMASAADTAEVVRACERALERSERIRLLARIERLAGIAPAALFQSDLFRFKWRARDRIERYAIVGGPNWLQRWVYILRGAADLPLRHFDARDEPLAWEWLEAEPAALQAAPAPTAE